MESAGPFLDLVLKSMLVSVLGWYWVQKLSRGADGRQGVMVVLSILVLLPLGLLWSAPVSVPVLDRGLHSLFSSSSSGTRLDARWDGALFEGLASSEPSSLDQGLASTRESRRVLPMNLFQLMAWIWALGAVCLGLRLVMGYVLGWRMLRRGELVTGEPWRWALERVGARLELGRETRMVVSDEVNTPMTFGLLRGTVVFPRQARFWSAHRLEAALIHELAHVRHRDVMLRAMASLVVSLYWFNPVVHALVRVLKREQERACDAVVLALGVRPSHYAAQLLSLASGRPSRRLSTLAAMGMSHRRDLSLRIASILEPPTQTEESVMKSRMVFIVLSLPLLIACGAVRLHAQPEPNPSSFPEPRPVVEAAYTPVPPGEVVQAPMLAVTEVEPPDAPEVPSPVELKALQEELEAEAMADVLSDLHAEQAEREAEAAERAERIERLTRELRSVTQAQEAERARELERFKIERARAAEIAEEAREQALLKAEQAREMERERRIRLEEQRERVLEAAERARERVARDTEMSEQQRAVVMDRLAEVKRQGENKEKQFQEQVERMRAQEAALKRHAEELKRAEQELKMRQKALQQREFELQQRAEQLEKAERDLDHPE